MVMTKKLFAYINKFTGDIKMLPKSEGKKLNEDWGQGKMATNDKGEKVYRFHIATPVVDKNGKTHMGVAVVDISEVETEEVDDGNGKSE